MAIATMALTAWAAALVRPCAAADRETATTGAHAHAEAQGVRVWALRATERVGLDSKPSPTAEFLQLPRLDFAAQRGERERAVLALRCDTADLRNVTVTFGQLQRVQSAEGAGRGSAPQLAAFRQGFVFVNQSGMLGTTNTTPSWQPDPLLPITAGGMELVPAARTQPIVVLLTVPPDATAGNYTATGVVAGRRGAAAFSVSVSVAVEVWALDLPPVSDPSTMGTVFNFVDNVCAPYRSVSHIQSLK